MFQRFLIMTWALSLIAIMAMSIRILFTSHDHCWSMGSRPYLACHLATCAFASVMGSLVGPSDSSPWNPVIHPWKS